MRLVIGQEEKITVINEIIGVSDLVYRINDVPSLTFSVPIFYYSKVDLWDNLVFDFDNKRFNGVVTDVIPVVEDNVLNIVANHIAHEWTRRQIPTNRAVKTMPMASLYEHTEFTPEGWEMCFYDNAQFFLVDYVYSRQTQLEALDVTTSLSAFIYWRVNPFKMERKIEVGTFGHDSCHLFTTGRDSNILSFQMSGKSINRVRNVAVVYGEKNDSGMPSVTLRDVYMNPQLQIEGFPIKIIREDANNERIYQYPLEYPAIAPNQNIEFAIFDEASIKDEGGHMVETTISFNDLSPFADANEVVTDYDRVYASATVYHRAIKHLISSRRYESIDIVVPELPDGLLVGDIVHIEFELPGDCETIIQRRTKYVREISVNFEQDNMITYTLILDDYVRVERNSNLSGDIYGAVQRIAERSFYTRFGMERMQLQRRNQTVDIYGRELTENGTELNPATFRLSRSPDMIYMERFEINITIEPYEPASETAIERIDAVRITGSGDTIPNEVLSQLHPGEYDFEFTLRDDNGVVATSSQFRRTREPVFGVVPHTPPPRIGLLHFRANNPTHIRAAPNFTTGNYSFNWSLSEIIPEEPEPFVDVDEYKIMINGFDATPLLQNLYGDRWINGAGTFPEQNETFDLLRVATIAEPALSTELLTNNEIEIQILGNTRFTAKVLLHLKYSYLNR